jgi:hypothetical protein
VSGVDETTDILRYSISMDKIELLSSLSTATYGGLAIQSSNGESIYYFGSWFSDTVVHKFNTNTNVTVRLPKELPSRVFYASGVADNGTIFIFNGQPRNILEFSESSGTAKIIGDLPFKDGDSNVYSTTAIPNGQDSVWLFAGDNPKVTNPVLDFNMTSKIVQISSVDTTSLPTLYGVPSSVSDGLHGFVIGGIGLAREIDGSFHPTNGILR